MANGTPHLTHFHIISLFSGGRGADRSTNQDAFDVLHGVPKCLSALGGSSGCVSWGHMFIRFVRRKTGGEFSQYLRVPR
jgi:hypothetical protein